MPASVGRGGAVEEASLGIHSLFTSALKHVCLKKRVADKLRPSLGRMTHLLKKQMVIIKYAPKRELIHKKVNHTACC